MMGRNVVVTGTIIRYHEKVDKALEKKQHLENMFYTKTNVWVLK